MKKQLVSMTILALLLASCGEEPPNRIRGAEDIQTFGTDTTSYRYLVSGLHHDPISNGQTMSYKSEKNAKGSFIAPYTALPKTSHTDLSEKVIDRPNVECGVDPLFNTLSERVQDCAKKNGAKAKMIGHQVGNTAEANWYLVVRTDNAMEVWLDSRTQMLWSDSIDKTNWCKASGSRDEKCNSANPSRVSYCTEALSLTLSSKGNLANQVAWRIPSKQDWMMADINGIRLAIADDGEDYWTATNSGEDDSKAWVYNGKTGASSTESRSNSNHVRCVGAYK